MMAIRNWKVVAVLIVVLWSFFAVGEKAIENTHEETVPFSFTDSGDREVNYEKGEQLPKYRETAYVIRYPNHKYDDEDEPRKHTKRTEKTVYEDEIRPNPQAPVKGWADEVDSTTAKKRKRTSTTTEAIPSTVSEDITPPRFLADKTSEYNSEGKVPSDNLEKKTIEIPKKQVQSLNPIKESQTEALPKPILKPAMKMFKKTTKQKLTVPEKSQTEQFRAQKNDSAKGGTSENPKLSKKAKKKKLMLNDDKKIVLVEDQSEELVPKKVKKTTKRQVSNVSPEPDETLSVSETQHHATHQESGGGQKKEQAYNAHGGAQKTQGYSNEKHVDKGAKGSSGKELHKSEYDESEGKKKLHHDDASQSAHHEENAHGTKGAQFDEKKGHKKGHKTKGYHNKYHKDEYHKEHKFYDDFHKGGSYHRYGKFHAKHKTNENGRKKAHHIDAGHDTAHHGKKGYTHKGKTDADHKGYNNKKGHQHHHSHKSHHGKKGGHSGGSRHAYQKKQK